MDLMELNNLILRLPKGRTPFSYFEQGYALRLLAYAVRTRLSLSALRRSPFQRLLDKPIIRSLLARVRHGMIYADDIRAAIPTLRVHYHLSVRTWGASFDHPWFQTSRPGYNLVLQLNFGDEHVRAYDHLIGPTGRHPFTRRDHPVLTGPDFTLAWARIDIDLYEGEALIEEVQSDWVRDAKSYAEHADAWVRNGEPDYLFEAAELDTSASRVLSYVDRSLAPHAREWADAMLTAAIVFLRDELTIHRIFYHHYESGIVLKQLKPTFAPPRSLYTDLPARFCFRETRRTPAALSRCPHDRVKKTVTENALKFFMLEI